MSLRDPVDLTNCDEEPIHVPGSIQPHGMLIACDAELAIVRRVSVNAASLLGLEGDIVGLSLEDVIDHEAIHRFRNALASSASASRPAAVIGLQIRDGRVFDAAIHRQGPDVVIELEPAPDIGQPLQIAREIIGRVGEMEDVDQLVAYTARLVAAVLDYDRVMIYRFEEDGSGKVISEAKRSHLESFLGQYFPATDIPRQARELYLRNTIRIIGDASCIRVPIEPELDSGGRALDLSFAHLRSVSPIHCEYLRNMGVSASMSISIIVDGSLWGLIACHHYAPKVLPMAQRLAMEMFGGFFSLQLKTLTERRRVMAATEARAGLDRLLREAHARTDTDTGTLLRKSMAEFARLVPNDGVGLWIDGEWTPEGFVPPRGAIEPLAAFLDTVCGGRIWSSSSLADHLSDAAQYSEAAAGLLAVPLSLAGSTYLLFFRKELVHTLDWAGNPEKTYETGPLGDRLTPRKSFAIWKETVRHKSQPWTEADRDMADATRAALVEIVLRHHEQMTDERRKADVRQRMLNEELTHRVKNILAVIQSLVVSPKGDRQTLEDYVSALQGRIRALSVAHDQVVRGGGGGALGDLLAAELGPYRASVASITTEGSRIWLDGRAFSVMALVLHEMATNAAKYGALSRKEGRLSVTWRLDETAACEIRWSEEGGPPVAPPSRTGFGSALTQRSIPFDLGGTSAVAFEPGGVKARFLIPAAHVAAMARAEESRPAPSPVEDAPELLRRLDPAILIVEDQLLIAMDLEADLEEAGLRVLGIASSVSQGMDVLEAKRPDLAILDVNLGNETSLPLAAELRRRGIPFVFATGYGDSAAISGDYADVPIVRKPYDRGAIVRGLARARSASGANAPVTSAAAGTVGGAALA